MFRTVTGYVDLEDSLLGSFTVLETMRMAAKLSLPNSVTFKQIEARVDDLVEAMGLATCRHTLVGDIFRKGLSGGQKRRLSIAIELLSNPSVFFLDEPTSGLDSSATHNVMRFIVKLCAEGKTIVCTIHQPSSLVYDMFTNVIVLSTGQTVYCGSRRQMVSHFASAGYDCPQYMNPAEYFISLVNTDFDDHADVHKLAQNYAQSDIRKELSGRIETVRKTLQHLPDIEQPSPPALRPVQHAHVSQHAQQHPQPGDLLDSLVHVLLSELHGGNHVPEHERRPDGGGPGAAAVLRAGVRDVHALCCRSSSSSAPWLRPSGPAATTRRAP